jgi:hypothetical protein
MKNKFEYYMEELKIYNEFEEGSRLWKGATNFAKKYGFNASKFRDKFIAIKEGVMKKNPKMDMGAAIAIAYNASRRLFFKKQNEMKKRKRMRMKNKKGMK